MPPSTRRAPAYRQLVAWQRAISLADCVYDVTNVFPPEERYGLTQQARRAAVSVSANLAEGNGQSSVQGRRYYFCVARGSVNELDSHLEIALRRGWISQESLSKVHEILDETARLISGLVTSLSDARQTRRSE